MDSTSFQIRKILSPFQRTHRQETRRIYCHESLDRLCEEFGINDDNYIVSLNGVIIDPLFWDTTIPRVGDEVIFMPLIQGGGDDELLRLVAVLALTIAAPGIAASLGGTLTGLSGAAVIQLTPLGLTALSAAVVIGGAMAINSLMPTPDTDRRQDFSGDFDASPNYAWNPHTTHREGLVSAKAYGRNKLYGNIRATWTEVTEGDPTGQTLKILLGLCQGPVKGIVTDTIKINDQRLDNFPDVSTEEKLGTSNQSVVSFMSGVKHELPVNRRFRFTGDEKAITGITQAANAKVSVASHGYKLGQAVNITDVSGMSEINRFNQFDQLFVTDADPDLDGNAFELDVNSTGFGAYTSGGIAFSGAITYTTPNKNFDKLEIEILFPNGHYQVLSSGGLRNAFMRAKIEISEAEAEVWSTLAETRIENTEITGSPVRFTFDSTVTYDGGAPVTITKGTQYDIRITRLWFRDDVQHSSGSNVVASSNKSYLGVVREVLTDAFIYPMRAMLAFQGLATDRLSGSIKLSCIQDGSIVPIDQNNNFTILNISSSATAVITAASGHGITSGDYVLFTGVNGMTEINDKMGRVTGTTATTITTNVDSSVFSAYSSGGTGWEYDLDWTDDPGSIIFDILTDPVITGDGGGTPYELDRFRGYPPSKINKVQLYAVTDYDNDLVDDGRGGTEKRVRFNGIFDTATDRWAAMLKVCEAARCIPVWNGVQIDFAIDRASSPVQKFNVANVDLDTFEESWLEQIGLGSEFELHYIDEDMDYKREILPVVDQSITSTSSRMTLNVMGLTRQSEIWRLAMLRLAKNRLLKSTISFTADIDAIDCTIGNNIYVQSDIPDQWGEGGRVISATTADIIIGKDLVYESGATYKLILRHADDTIDSKDVLNINNTITGVTASTFVITGNYTSVYKEGDKITVSGSTGNDRIYTLSTGSTFGGGNTTITVEELVVSSTVDGGLYNNRRVVVSVAFGTAPEAGDLWTWGEQDIHIYTVLNLSRDVDQKVRLSCLEYNAAIYDPDSDTPLITIDQGITAPESAPFAQEAINWTDVASRYPTLATIGPPVQDVPTYTGIVFSDNVPNNRVDWTLGTITYRGAGYSITAGNSGSLKYVYWDVNSNPTTLQSSNTQADGVGEGRFIRCINDNGIARVIGQGNLFWGEMLIVETLSALAIQVGDLIGGSLTGTVLTGGLIRTATSGQRLEIDSDGIRLLSAAPTAGVIGTAGSGGSDIVIGTAINKTITAITQAANAKITAASHGFAVGNKVRITGVVGMTEINYENAGLATITDNDPDVDGNKFEVGINSTAFTAYSSDGDAQVGSGEIPGSGVLATINHPDKDVPFRIESEQIHGDFHYFNRGATPSGAAEVADKCVVNGDDQTCTVAGTPGTWVVTGTQT